MDRNFNIAEQVAVPHIDLAQALSREHSMDQSEAWHLRELFDEDPQLRHDHSTKAFIRHYRRLQRMHA